MKTQNKKKKWKIIVPVVIVLIIVIAVVAGGKKQSGNMAVQVETAKVQKGDITATLETSGTIGSEKIRSYASPVTAEVETVNIQAGDTVKKGDYLVTYNTASLEKSYTISQLQAKSEEAANDKSLEMSNKAGAQAAQAAAQIQSLQGQIDSAGGQIAEWNGQLQKYKEDAEKETAIGNRLAQINSRLEELKKKEDRSEEESAEIENLEKEKKEQEKALQACAGASKTAAELEKQIAALQAQLEGLLSSRAEAEARKESGEAAVLTEAERQGIQSSKQAARLTLSQSADALQAAQAGITAEFDGIVMSCDITAGSTAQEGMSMFQIADSSSVCVDFQLSKYNLQDVKQDQKVTVTSLDKKYKGHVSFIGKMAERTESGAAMASAKVHIENPDEDLVLGLDAQLEIQLGSKKNVLVVPIAAVNTDTEGDFVYVLEHGKVKQKYVTTGFASKEEIEIQEGLKEGEEVITTIDASITDGMEVSAIAEESKTDDQKE